MHLPSRAELVAMMRLALPVVTAQVGLMMMGVVDTLMVGRVSAEALAGVALGNLYFMALIIPASGTLMVIDPIVSQAVGARDREAVARGVQRGLLLAAGLGILVSMVLLPARSVLVLLRQPDALVPLASSYVLISILGVFPYLGFVVLRQSLQALRETRAMVIVIVVANLGNAFLNWVLIYGHLGSPPLGVAGSAWATVASRWLMALMLLAMGAKVLKRSLVPWRRESQHLAPLRAMLKLGVPIGMHQGVELAAFATIGVLMGVLGTREMAAHQVAINLASLTFMVPLGVGAAAAVRVGHATGAGDANGAREAAKAALVCGAGFMMLAAAVLLAFPRAIASLYTPDLAVGALAAALIPIAGVFQVFDGVQAVSSGVLRGLGDTRVPFFLNVTGFWLAGFPVSIALGFYTPLGALGLWWGFVAGLAVVAGLLLFRVRSLLRGPIARTVVEEDALHLATEP